MEVSLQQVDDALARELMRRSAERVGVENVMLWLVDEASDELVATAGVGGQAEKFEGAFRQPLSEGLVSLAYQSGHASCHNSLQDDPDHSKRLDREIGQRTEHMIVAPVQSVSKRLGVVSAVQITRGAAPFQASDIAELEFLAACLGRVIGSAS